MLENAARRPHVASPLAGGRAAAYALWRRLTSVRFALGLIGVLAVAALLGVLVPQMPEGVRDSPQLRRDFVANHDGLGPLAPVFDRLQLFTVFHSWWFLSLLGLLTLSVAVCTWSRFAPIRRQVTRPQMRVPDGYLERAHHRAEFPASGSADALAAALRRRHYRTVVMRGEDGTRVYADRFRWAAFGTFASHLSLIIFLVGGLVTWAFEDRTQVVVAEGASAAVFAPADSRHMQVRLVNFERTLNAEGRETAIASEIEVYRHGQLVARGQTSINRPLHAGGFTFHQSGFFEQGAALQVHDAAGRLVYDEVVPLQGVLPVPVVRLSGPDDAPLFEGPAPATVVLQGMTAASSLKLPGEGSVVFALRPPQNGGPWRIAASSGAAVAETAAGGELALPDGYRLAFEGVTASASDVAKLPGAVEGDWLVQMLAGANRSLLTLVTPQGEELRLQPGQEAQSGGYTYSFAGQRAFSAMTVRDDPGSLFIWVATALLIGGLLLTFYVPRHQLWLLDDGTRLRVAGVGRFRRGLAEEVAWLGRAGERRESG